MKNKDYVISVLLFLSVFFMFVSCGTKQDIVEKKIEDGVEIIINHLEPYKIERESSSFILEEKLVLDTQLDDIAEKGLTDISSFDIDSEGNIYCLNYRSKNDFIYKFDKNGKFVTSFGRKGQGPGEIQRTSHFEIDNQEQIVVTDEGTKKLLYFSREGNFLKELKSEIFFMRAHPLENGKYLIWHQIIGKPTEEYLIQTPLSLFNPKLDEGKELDRYKLPNYRVTKKRNGIEPLFTWAVSKNHIYIGNEERAYEIWVFDLDGRLIRKVRKEYQPVNIPEEFKKERIKMLPERFRKVTFFPDNFPPFQGIFADDSDRLFVMTYEKDDSTGEFIFDIFNSEGSFVGRCTIEAMCQSGIVMARIKGNLIYCVSEKDNGYKYLGVYKMKWE